MMLTISLAILSENKQIDIMVNEEQRISNTLEVIEEQGMIRENKNVVLRSQRSRQRIDPQHSYKEERIYNGDILCMESLSRRNP